MDFHKRLAPSSFFSVSLVFLSRGGTGGSNFQKL